jgi:autotransporter-associated beta strand protein
MDSLRKDRVARGWSARRAVLAVSTAACCLLHAPLWADTVVQLDFNYAKPNTTISSVQVQLFNTQAPITVNNFLLYIDAGDYDWSLVHRSVPAFVVQGGDVRVNAAGTAWEYVPSYGTITNEFDPSRSNVRGTIAMAKQPGNPNSASNQWFFNVADNSANLDTQNGGFTVFGQVLGTGMELVDYLNGLRSYAQYMSEIDPANSATYYNSYFAAAPVVEFTDGSADFVLVTATSRVASPATFDWQGANAQNLNPTYWSRADNWGPTFGVPDAVGAVVALGSQGAGSSVVDLRATGRTVGSLTFATSASTTVQGTGTLTFNNGVGAALLAVSAGSHTIAAPLTLGSDLNVTIDGTLLTLAGPIGGAKSLTKSGAGTLTLRAVNTYTGATAVSGGILKLTGAGTARATSGVTVGSAAGAKLVLDSSTSALDAKTPIANNGAIEVTATSAQQVGAISGAGTTTVLAGASLTADSIVQNALAAGPGASVTISAGGGAATTSSLLSGTDTPYHPEDAAASADPVGVPEPTAAILLSMGGVCLLFMGAWRRAVCQQWYLSWGGTGKMLDKVFGPSKIRK